MGIGYLKSDANFSNGFASKRKIFVDESTKMRHQAEVTERKQTEFRELEKAPISKNARESFKRKPYSV